MGHSPLHSHKILLVPSRCAAASLGVSWGIAGLEPVSAVHLACGKKTHETDVPPLPIPNGDKPPGDPRPVPVVM